MRQLILSAFISISFCWINTTAEHRIWSTCSNGSCTCGADLTNVIECYNINGEDRLSIQKCYCLYYDNNTNVTVAGVCFYTCFKGEKFDFQLSYSTPWYSVQNQSQFNDEVCNSAAMLNRQGKFCGQCKSNYGNPMYSYNTACIKCHDHWGGFRRWLQYFAIAYGPFTIFYSIIVVFRISLPTSRLNGLLFVIQCLASPHPVRLVHTWLLTSQGKNNHPASVMGYIILSIIGLSNLDFFKDLYPNLCLSPNYSLLFVISLDLMVAVYPYFLIFCTYCLVILHDRNCCIVVFLWKTFKGLMKQVLNKSVRVPLVETFATFTLLSTVKIIGLATDLLKYTTAYREDGSLEGKYAYYDPSMTYFGRTHRPYAIMAIILSFLFGFLPFLLLLLYPCRCFQNLLNFFNFRSHSLHVFMDAFQGSYRTGQPEMRYFAAWYILLRFLVLFFAACLNSVVALQAVSFTMTVGAVTVVVFKPYKKSLHNTQDTVILLSGALLFLSLFGNSTTDNRDLYLTQVTVMLSFMFFIVATLASFFWNPAAKVACKIFTSCRSNLESRELLANT